LSDFVGTKSVGRGGEARSRRRVDGRSAGARGDASLPDELKAAAVKLFQARGYSGVTVDDIVREVGVTKGGFYHYFESKGELLFALHNDYVTYSVEQFKQAFAAAGEPEKQLDAFVRETFRQIHEYQGHVGVLFDERRFLPEDKIEEVEGKKDELRRMLVEVIEKGIAKGVFRAVDSQAVSLAIFGMCMWGYQWYRPDGKLTYEQLADQFAALVHQGLDAEVK
jgi:AcrR family transcriptional regulator